MAHVQSRRKVLTTLAGSLLSVPALLNARLSSASAAAGKQIPVYVGTYTDGSKSKGIYRLVLDLETGAMGQPAQLAAELVNPSFLTIHPGKPLLYAVNEVAAQDGKPEGSVTGFKIGPQGSLQMINRLPSDGRGPCHLSVAPGGDAVLVANYGSGSLGVKQIDSATGELKPAGEPFQGKGSSVDKGRQEGPHAHCVRFDPSGKFAVEADLGLDKVHVFQFPNPEKGGSPWKLVNTIAAKPGSGPRHLAFHPSGKFLFVCGEMDLTLTGYRFDPATGATEEIGRLSTLPAGDHPGSSTAETVMHPSGKFVYVSNRGHHTIARFGFDADTAKLTALGHTPTGGKTPRNFNIDPTGNWLLVANQDSDTVTVFRINTATGDLTQVGQPVEVPKPVCLVFDTARISG